MAEMSEDMRSYLECTGSSSWYDKAEAEGRHDELAAFLRGLGSGFYAFAWWKDGKQYVGSCGTLLSHSMAVIRDEVDRLEAIEKGGFNRKE